MDERVVIRPLEERPDAAVLLAEWFMAEWPQYHRGKTLGDVSSVFRLRDVQQTFIAERDGEVVGTVALRKSWSDAPQISTPWVGGLFVRPKDRRRGVAMALVEAACQHAFSLGHEAVHVAVRQGVNGYESRGWTMIGTMKTRDEMVTVMRRDIG